MISFGFSASSHINSISGTKWRGCAHK